MKAEKLFNAFTFFLTGCLVGFILSDIVRKELVSEPVRIEKRFGYTVLSADSIMYCDGTKAKRVWINK